MRLKEGGRYSTGSSECLVRRPVRLPLSTRRPPESGACRPARLKTGCRNEASLQSPILIECFLIPRLELQHSGRIYETSRPFGNISVQQEQGTMQSLMDALYQPPPG